MDRLRTQRLARLKDTLEQSDLGALLCFDFANIRYMTATHIGTWAIDKLIRFALLPRGGEPIIWDFGSAAKHHLLYNPWLDHGHAHAGTPDESCHQTHGSRPGLSTLRGAIPPGAGMADDVATKIYDVLAEYGLENEAIGIDVVEMPVLAALNGTQAERRRRPTGVPRGAADQDRRRDHDAHPCLFDGRRRLRRAVPIPPPGSSRERMCRGRQQDAARPRFRVRRGRQRDLRRALLAAPPRLQRPHHPAGRPGVLRHPAQLQRLSHVLLPHVPGGQRLAGATRCLQDLP